MHDLGYVISPLESGFPAFLMGPTIPVAKDGPEAKIREHLVAGLSQCQFFPLSCGIDSCSRIYGRSCAIPEGKDTRGKVKPEGI